MGSRANYITIKNGTTEIHYHHWGAQVIAHDMFWGETVAQEFISKLPLQDELLDDVWCEGAVVLDSDRRTFIFFSNADLKWSNTLKRVYMALLRLSWDGWEVSWARHGLHTLLEYLKNPPGDLISPEPEIGHTLNETAFIESSQWDGALISILKNGELHHYEMDFRADDFLSQGMRALTYLEGIPMKRIQKESRSHEYDSYLFMDRDNKLIAYDNEFEHHHRLYQRLAEYWPGWTLVEHDMGMYGHSRYCGIPWQELVMDEDIAAAAITDMLLNSRDLDPADTLKALSKHGLEVRPNTSHFFQSDTPAVTRACKEACFRHILAQWTTTEDHYRQALTNEIG